ncbi:hypothetical protein [Streptomyces sp. Tu 3180]|uniref:hypothetical protein n=1 Tax=Streptomyces sp. Tu 3180 TaxID=2682611 RepID=UPI00135B4404|nr:hypothetical protein [Streptomyces sp. Tu 3180]KAF3469281.1 hypothetical protein GL259_36780 [Streptomyces sp. Tu 3180]
MVAATAVWTTEPDGTSIHGLDIAYVRDHVHGALHPVAHAYTMHFAGLVEVTLLLGLTPGVRGPRARFVAGSVAVLTAAVLALLAVNTLTETSPYADPSRALLDRTAAAVLIALALATLCAAVVLMRRGFVFYDGFVIAFLAGAGILHVVSMFLLAAVLDPRMSLTVWAWAPALCHLPAAGCAAALAAGTAADRREAVRPLPA